MFKIVMRGPNYYDIDHQMKKKLYDKEIYFNKSWKDFMNQCNNWSMPTKYQKGGTYTLAAFQMNENEKWVQISHYVSGQNPNVVPKKLNNNITGKFGYYSFEITEEKKNKIIKRLLEYYKKNECFGEGIYQNDQSQIDSIEVMSDIADNIIQFKCDEDEEEIK